MFSYESLLAMSGHLNPMILFLLPNAIHSRKTVNLYNIKNLVKFNLTQDYFSESDGSGPNRSAKALAKYLISVDI